VILMIDRVVEPFHDGLAARFERHRLAAHLDRTGLPRRQHIIDHQRRDPLRLPSRNFLRLAKSCPPMSMLSGVGVVPEGDRNDIGHAVVADRRSRSLPR